MKNRFDVEDDEQHGHDIIARGKPAAGRAAVAGTPGFIGLHGRPVPMPLAQDIGDPDHPGHDGEDGCGVDGERPEESVHVQIMFMRDAPPEVRPHLVGEKDAPSLPGLTMAAGRPSGRVPRVDRFERRRLVLAGDEKDDDVGRR